MSEERMVTVYRVENMESRKGPYVCTSIYNRIWQDAITDHYDDNTHPEPDEDGCSYIKDDEYCGFDSMHSLLRWFSYDELDILLKNNFHIRTYTVPYADVRFGRKQLVFKRSKTSIV